MALAGLYWCGRNHRLLTRPTRRMVAENVRPIFAIAWPAILTNVATPVGNAYITAALAPFGDEAVAAWAVIGRVIPVAFGPLFALTGAVGPIFGQNLGARKFDRLRTTLRDSLLLILIYVLAVWIIMALGREAIASGFGLTAAGRSIVEFFCLVSAGSFMFLGALFVSNAAFNNLGAPLFSTVFNWGRATLGTIPFVWAGARLMGPNGVILGQSVGFRCLRHRRNGVRLPAAGEDPRIRQCDAAGPCAASGGGGDAAPVLPPGCGRHRPVILAA